MKIASFNTNGIRARMPIVLGWRIDHIWATRSMTERAVAARIDPEPRSLERPSDHTLIMAEFE